MRYLLLLLLMSGCIPSFSFSGFEEGVFTLHQETCGVYENTRQRFSNELYLAPDIYHVNRTREGGTKQNGWIYGVRGGYEHIKRYNVYFGCDVMYGQGRLSGHSGSNSKIKSNFIDFNSEARVGYTFQQKYGRRFALTPFIGGGYAVEKNNFISPSPLPFHFRIRYSYASAGFLSQANLLENMIGGINFKVKFMLDAKNRVTNDPNNEPLSMLINNELHYLVEVPLTYWFCSISRWYVSLVPFYEFRHYGGQPGYPFDFLDTKLNIYGVALKINTGW